MAFSRQKFYKRGKFSWIVNSKSSKLARKLAHKPLSRSLSEPPKIVAERVDDSPAGSPGLKRKPQSLDEPSPSPTRATATMPYWYRMHLRRQVPVDCICK